MSRRCRPGLDAIGSIVTTGSSGGSSGSGACGCMPRGHMPQELALCQEIFVTGELVPDPAFQILATITNATSPDGDEVPTQYWGNTNPESGGYATSGPDPWRWPSNGFTQHTTPTWQENDTPAPNNTPWGAINEGIPSLQAGRFQPWRIVTDDPPEGNFHLEAVMGTSVNGGITTPTLIPINCHICEDNMDDGEHGSGYSNEGFPITSLVEPGDTVEFSYWAQAPDQGSDPEDPDHGSPQIDGFIEVREPGFPLSPPIQVLYHIDTTPNVTLDNTWQQFSSPPIEIPEGTDSGFWYLTFGIIGITDGDNACRLWVGGVHGTRTPA